MLLVTLGLSYISLTPFCLLPTSSIVCGLRDLGPSAVLSLCLEVAVTDAEATRPDAVASATLIHTDL